MSSGRPDFAMPETSTSLRTSASLRSRFSRWWSRARTSFFWMFLLAFGLRVGTILVLHTYKFKTADAHFSIGWEMGRIGEAIASGHGFSDPFEGHTGPTAWEPPLYPYLVAAVFKLFGIYTHASAFVLLTLSSLFSALTCIPIYLIARRCFGEKVAIASAWTWALLPYVMFWSTKVVWETSLSALLYTVIFWLTLTMEERNGVRPWIAYGLLWGIAGLNSTVLLAFLPASGLWIWYHRHKQGKPSVGGLVLAALLFIACMAPWTVRNYRTFGKLMLGRDNFGAELRMGNGPWADGTWMVYLHPTQNLYALHEYQQMGEIAYIAMRKQQAMDFIREDRGRFLWLCFKRFIYYWAGVPKGSEIWWLAQTKNSLFLASSVLMFWGLGRALRKKMPGAGLFFWIILLTPFVYYIVFPYPRYRHPIEPEIVILGVFLITEAEIHGKPIGAE